MKRRIRRAIGGVVGTWLATPAAAASQSVSDAATEGSLPFGIAPVQFVVGGLVVAAVLIAAGVLLHRRLGERRAAEAAAAARTHDDGEVHWPLQPLVYPAPRLARPASAQPEAPVPFRSEAVRPAPAHREPVQLEPPDVERVGAARSAADPDDVFADIEDVPLDATLQLLPGRFEVVEGETELHEVRFVRSPKGENVITFGRNAANRFNHVQLDSPTVSARHAIMSYEGGTWRIRNLSQTNPVVVNGVELSAGNGARALREGDRVELGAITFRFRSH